MSSGEEEIIEEDILDSKSESISDDLPLYYSNTTDNNPLDLSKNLDDDKLFNVDTELSEIAKHFQEPEASNSGATRSDDKNKKEISPLSDDVILINDKKVSIHSLDSNVKPKKELSFDMDSIEDVKFDVDDDVENDFSIDELEICSESLEKLERDPEEIITKPLKSLYDQTKIGMENFHIEQKDKNRSIEALNLHSVDVNNWLHFKSVYKKNPPKDYTSLATTASTEYRTLQNEDYRLIEKDLMERLMATEEENHKLKTLNQELTRKLDTDETDHQKSQVPISSVKKDSIERVIHDFTEMLTPEEKENYSSTLLKLKNYFDTRVCAADNEEIVTEKIQAIEAKHCKEMEDLRKYFEKRCIDIEKQYSDEVFSMRSSRKSDMLPSSDDESDELKNDDALENNESKVSDSKPEIDESQQAKINWARELVLRELESQIQNLLFDNNCEQYEWPQELIILRDQFTARCQQEVATIQKTHEQELAKLKHESELELKKLIEERENIKDISTTLRLTLEEVMKMISVNNLTTEDSLNISSLKDQKINLFIENSLEHEATSMRDNDKSEFNVSISKVDVEECLYRLRIEAANILDLSKRYFKQNEVEQLYMHPDPIADDILFDNILRKSKSFPSIFVDRFGRNEKRGILMDVENLKLFEEKSTSANLLPQINFEIPNETFVEGFGKCSPVHLKKKSLLMDLKSKTKNLLTSLYNENIENSMDHQFLRKFNEEIDTILEFEKMEKEDLQLQIDAADKQLKSTRAFLEQQTAEREQERDEFNKEIEYLKNILKEKDKDKLIHQKLIKENEYLQQNVKEISKKNEELEEQSSQLEKDLKASVEKICVLREIIAELETQVAEKDALNDTIENTADIIENSESFAQEIVQKNAEVADSDLMKKVTKLEDHIETLNVEHHEIMSKINSQLMSIECAIDRKIEGLEACNTIYSSTCMSPTEDISARAANRTETEDTFSYIEQLQRIFEKLSKHSCIEEATLKRIADLEMHVERSKMIINEMQQEKEIVQEKVTEQDMKIASLQMRLDETRMRAEKVNNSELIIKIQDLQNQIKQLSEELEFRDRQISSLNSMLETSKQLISDQDKQLVADIETERILKEELLEARTELAQMEEKIKNEMVSRARISDLMDSLIGEKNIEMSTLEQKLRSRDKEIAYLRNMVESKISHESNLLLAKTYDEPDVLRDVAEDNHKDPPYSLNFPTKITNQDNFTMLEKSRSLGSVALNTQSPYTFNFMNPSISSIPEISNVPQLEKSDDRLSIDALTQVNNEELMHEKQLLEQELIELRELKAQNEIAEINRIKEQTKELELQLECKDKDIDTLKSLLVTKDEHLQSLSTEIAQAKHLHDTQIELVNEIETLKHQILELSERINEKDHHIEHLSAQNKLNKIDSNEIENLRRELSLKSFALEKCKYDLQDYENQIVQLKERFVKSEQKMVEPINVDEITEKLEKELNYSAELDYNLMKAFESDPLGGRKELRLEKNFKEKYEEVLQDLDSERKYFKYMHMHDVSLLESVKMRLNTAMESENVLKKLLDAEQQKNENLVAQLNKVNIDLLNAHPNSLKYLESEVILRLNNEIDYLKNRNSSEENRILELQKIIENESQRFSRAFAELSDYCDTLKKNIKKLKHEKENLELEIYRGNQNVLSPTEKFQLQELNEIENKRNIVIMHELEDRLHHLLIKYLRSESYRKALVYQKRYLMVISTKVTSKSTKKRKSFKVVVFAIIAIWRMKYIAKRWTNKKMSGKLICMTPTMPKRSQSTSTNKWATIPHHTNRC